ncbi:MEDS domain-containing protein [Dactylosporangium sp. CS-033363]|uniref:MEDS domain-containing protein n=1 Tax=Dactylosporangium sp. CS-033363 TaxID=3239935 RepID=UPI003D945EB5
MNAPIGRPTRGRFEHTALIVDSDDALDRSLLPVLRRHVSTGEPTLIVVSPDTRRRLRALLGPDADAEALTWGESDAFYQRLGFAYESFRRFLEQQHALGRSVHVIAEPDIPTDLDAPVDRVAAYLSYESVCNDAYASYGCPVTCLWDSRRHPTLVIENVRSIHDHELTDRGKRLSTTFVPASAYLAGRAEVAMPAPPDVAETDLALSVLPDIATGREAITAWAAARGFAAPAVRQVSSAVNEVLTNALQHGTAPVRLRGWRHGSMLVVQVDDSGGRAIPPDAGYRPPAQSPTGLGLWIARQFADIVLTRTTPGNTAVRLYFPHALTHRGPEA